MRLLVTKYPRQFIELYNTQVYLDHFGFLCIPNGMSPKRASDLSAVWGMDNLAFKGFNPVKYRKMLSKFNHIAGCKFVVVPDVPGDALSTLALFDQWHNEIRLMGYPLALTAQNGIEDIDVQWDQFDALFVGGTDTWRFSSAMIDIVKEAQQRGKWVHLGRVNSAKRIRKAQELDFDSCDGSSYATHFHKVATHYPYLSTLQMTLGI